MPGRDEATWRVGVLFSRSGVSGITETEHFLGTALAIEEINTAGGVLGRPIVPICYDPAGDTDAYRAYARRMLAEDGAEVAAEDAAGGESIPAAEAMPGLSAPEGTESVPAGEAMPLMESAILDVHSTGRAGMQGGDSGGPAFLGDITNNGLFVSFTALTVSIPLFLPLTVGVVAGDTVAGEASHGTIRYLLVAPTGRLRFATEP